MFAFIVPIKSSKLASDWTAFSNLVERTLKSICNQNNDNFKVIVACHEMPDISYENDKIKFIQVPFAPPQLVENDWDKNRELKEGDKANKILVAYEQAKTYNPEYIMVVDADDCISNSIVSFVSKQEDGLPGWFVEKGYYYKEGTSYLFLNKKTFNNLCGTCIIIRTDLFPQIITTEPWLYYYHELKQLPNKTHLHPLPFPAALYSMANGENHFMSNDHAVKLLKNKNSKKSYKDLITNLYNKFKKYSVRPITPKFKRTFGFYNV